MGYEVNFDGLVGLTHNYAGLSYGNVASMNNQAKPSSPREAALQGLEKMYRLYKLGIQQAVLPPHQRPYLPTLRAIGFTGTDKEILQNASTNAPEIFLACCSSANMWTANAATVSPSIDCADGKLHLTTANLYSNFHRALEAPVTYDLLQQIFHDTKYFVNHQPLPLGTVFSDEGAANHSRFFSKNSQVELFIYGRNAFKQEQPLPKKFPARQTLEASQAIARRHRLNIGQTIFAQQNPEAIDAGAFHNDVISVSHGNLFLYHEKAFVNTSETVAAIQKAFRDELHLIEIKESEVSLRDAVASYLFNSQIVTLPTGKLAFIVPSECMEIASVKNCLDRIKGTGLISEIFPFNLRQSMQNGGGPACLRLRVMMNEKEFATMHHGVLLDDILYQQLVDWVKEYYRDRLVTDDLRDPELLEEGRAALEELNKILNLDMKIF